MAADIEHFHSFIDPEEPEVRDRLIVFVAKHCDEDTDQVVSMLGLDGVEA